MGIEIKMDAEQTIQEGVRTNEVSLKQLFLGFRKCYHYLLSKWWIILFFAIIGSSIAFLYARFRKTVYTAETSFVLEDSASSGAGALGGLGGLASMVGIDVAGGGGIFQGDNILELYKSRTMITNTLLTEISRQGHKELLIESFIKMNNLRDKWKDKPGLSSIHFKKNKINSLSNTTRLQDSILISIVKEINDKYLVVGKPDKKLSIIKVEVNAPDELFAKTFNDQIVKNVNDFYIQTKTKKSIENVEILQTKTDSVRSIINGAINQSAAVSDATPNLNATRLSQRVSPVQRSQFNAETNRAILAELIKNLEMAKISLHRETPLIQVIDYPILPLNVDKISKAKAIVLGGILAIFLSITFFTAKLIFKHIIKEY